MDRKLLILFGCLSVCFCSPVDQFADVSDNFHSEFYQTVVDGVNDNVVMSPVSLQIALTMVYMGATGETEKEMRNSMKYTPYNSKQGVSDAIQGLISELKNTEGVNMANKIYVKENVSIRPKFKEIVTRNFDSEVENINFGESVAAAKKINEWVESKTNNRIKNLVDRSLLNEGTRMVILNALHFKRRWQKEFSESSTKKQTFYLNDRDAIQADFMKTTKHFKYGVVPELSASIIEIPYENYDTSMVIILPNARNGLIDVERKLNQVNLNRIIANLESQRIKLELPKFKVEYKLDLNAALMKLGMNRMFSGAAEFRELLDKDENLMVSKVIQKAFIEVNEKGTEAAAAIAIIMRLTSGYYPHKEMELRIDHPFLFIVRTNNYNLFMGKIVNPMV